jgi:hypothetical protein
MTDAEFHRQIAMLPRLSAARQTDMLGPLRRHAKIGFALAQEHEIAGWLAWVQCLTVLLEALAARIDE